ncbi:MAG: hypothetical protein N5P05_002757 [Chroococcopsis gigantea SAG 12.99]|jgi:hypothetical protein|nr:hypothetical protein [Chroococcopsis gigantea SAG 12.99]
MLSLITIARRLDSLGALTKGQRQTGGQGLFRPEDNLESNYAKATLRQLFVAVCTGRLECCSLADFEAQTGLSLTTENGVMKEELPGIPVFLNRVLALPISRQNALFEEFELRLAAKIEEAVASGTYEVGVETLKAESLEVLERRVIYTHPETGAQSHCVKIRRRQKAKILGLQDALDLGERHRGQFLFNERSGRVAVAIPTNSTVSDEGAIVRRLNLIRPAGNEKLTLAQFNASTWKEIGQRRFEELWRAEVDTASPFDVDCFYLITGLLLPIWNRLDAENMKVFRLQTDDGEKLLGRLVNAENIGSVFRNLGIGDTPGLAPDEVLRAVIERRQVMPLRGGWQLRASSVMGNQRLEITGVRGEAEVMRLKALGCMTEVINWKLRVFIPRDDRALWVIEKIRELA